MKRRLTMLALWIVAVICVMIVNNCGRKTQVKPQMDAPVFTMEFDKLSFSLYDRPQVQYEVKLTYIEQESVEINGMKYKSLTKWGSSVGDDGIKLCFANTVNKLSMQHEGMELELNFVGHPRLYCIGGYRNYISTVYFNLVDSLDAKKVADCLKQMDVVEYYKEE